MSYLQDIGRGHPAEAPYLQQLHDLVVEVNAHRVLEIGSGKFTFSRAILHGLEKTKGFLHTCDPFVKQTHTHPNMLFHQIKSDVLAKEWSDPIDLLMIDGDHSKHQVFKDYYNFTDFIQTPGFVVFHDLNIPHGKGIRELWEHLKKDHRVRLEITTWPGFGALYV